MPLDNLVYNELKYFVPFYETMLEQMPELPGTSILLMRLAKLDADCSSSVDTVCVWRCAPGSSRTLSRRTFWTNAATGASLLVRRRRTWANVLPLCVP